MDTSQNTHRQPFAWARYEPTAERQSRSLSKLQIALTQRPDRRPNHRPHNPANHSPPSVLNRHEIGDGASAQRNGAAGAEAGQKAEGDQRAQAAGAGTGDVEGQEDEVAHVVVDLAAVQLRQRRDHQRPERVPDQIHGRDEGAERGVGRVEGGEHGRC